MLLPLTGILGLATLALTVLGVRQWRRRRMVARAAHRIGLRFAADDPLEMTRRYGAFALVRGGHSARAENVVFGRVKGCYLRAFDFSIEAGHGPHRAIRRCGVVAADARSAMGDALLWRGEGACPSSLPVPRARVLPEGWQGDGEADLTDRLAGAWRAEPGGVGEPVSVECRQGLLLFALPRWADGAALTRCLEAVAECLEKLSQTPAAIPRKPAMEH